ncbi:MAG: hypothetical protein H0T43_01095, partial [Solirubrobacterales bacterium]|nr:hypothetical protein [Solirubrobacterales bacterium]
MSSSRSGSRTALALTAALALAWLAGLDSPPAGAADPGARPRPAGIDRPARSRTVPGSLRSARLLRRLSGEQHDAHRRLYRDARREIGRLSGVRRRELRAVVAAIESIAARRMLSASRIKPAFETLRRNLDHWRRRGAPRPGSRFETAEGVVFEYYPGRGFQLQALASWGRVNGLARACQAARARVRDGERAVEA